MADLDLRDYHADAEEADTIDTMTGGHPETATERYIIATLTTMASD